MMRSLLRQWDSLHRLVVRHRPGRCKSSGRPLLRHAERSSLRHAERSSLRHAERKRSIYTIVLWATVLLGGLWYLFCLPRELFKGAAYSTVVLDRNGRLLGARIAPDGQWKFPPCDSVPHKYETALIEFEDRHFRQHPGVNPVSILRALRDNLKAGHVTSGGSTITMQVIRLSRRKERTLWQKLIEAVMATRLELRCSKDEILALYASHAPFGGNVVGIDAAAWRYFGRPSVELSWGEAATLAVLPNSPSSMHPGKGRAELKAKRDRLLHRLLERAAIDSLSYSLAIDEKLPDAPLPLPRYAPQFCERFYKTRPGQTIRSSIDLGLQKRLENVTSWWSDGLALNGINDLAAIVMDVRTGDILAYCGNSSPSRVREGSDVDIASAPRSTGSILKPFLYCAALQDGVILPRTLLPDVPVNIGGFNPQNFDLQFSGAVPASEALARSLNVPSVQLLRLYGVTKFHHLLRELGMTSVTRSADDYGLSLILGGAEGKLEDICSIYASMSRAYQYGGDFPLGDKAALWYSFDALKEVKRPDEIDWRLISSVKKIAWKTGTSYGFRDAWAVGVNPDYAVGVWAGNAQGQGVPGLVGAKTAGPVMFDIFNLLPSLGTDNAYTHDGWFCEPLPSDGVRVEICRESGYLRGMNCADIDTVLVSKAALRSASCPYHMMADGKPVFRLPPAMEWYYRQRHPEYQSIVPKENRAVMEFIYPKNGSVLTIPRQLDGSVKGIIFNLAHRDSGATVFWHLDQDYLGETRFIHQMSLIPPPGRHSLTVVDDRGNSLSVGFTVSPHLSQ